MKRKIDETLDTWKISPRRKPLVLFGARQTGKTTSVLAFAQRSFQQVMHIDFIKRPELKSAFIGSLEPNVVIANLSAMMRQPVSPDTTLIFFDEVQECDSAVTALKYFCTDAPQWHVIAAGSLLGVRIARDGYSFPVGYVDIDTMHPMDFEEYCWALGDEAAFNIARQCLDGYAPCPAHDMLMRRYREYLMVGGMPEVVVLQANGENLELSRRTQATISESYMADMAKHAENTDATKIAACWESIPSQLAKENESKKFTWKNVASGARADRYSSAVDWLRAAGIVDACTQVSAGESPLKSFENPHAFKLYLADTGLLSCKYDAIPQDLDDTGPRTARFRGALAENYVMQQLVSSGLKPYYWGMQSKGEVEFIVRGHDGVVPIEVKSGSNVKSTSALNFAKKYGCPYVVRITAKNFGETELVKSLPLYAANLIAEL